MSATPGKHYDSPTTNSTILANVQRNVRRSFPSSWPQSPLTPALRTKPRKLPSRSSTFQSWSTAVTRGRAVRDVVGMFEGWPGTDGSAALRRVIKLDAIVANAIDFYLPMRGIRFLRRVPNRFEDMRCTGIVPCPVYLRPFHTFSWVIRIAPTCEGRPR